MKAKGITAIILGIAGAVFVLTFDIITGKPVNDISGPKSISALVICGFLVLMGISFLLRSNKK